MFRNLMIVVLFMLLPFGAVACTRKPPAVPTSTVSYETAMEAITELAERVKDGEKRLTELEQGTDESVLERLTTMEETLSKIEEFRAENPGHFGRVVDTTFVDRIRFECTGEVTGFGLRDLFKLGGKTLFCTQPGVARPADGSVCYNIPGTHFWDCGFGQILRECVQCGCGTPTNTPEAQKSATPTNTPEAQKSATPTNTSEAQKSATPTNTSEAQKSATPTTQPIPTNQPTPEGTKECKCLDVKIDFAYEAKVEPNVFGTKVTDPGNGFMVFLGGVADSFMETSWDDCQYFVGNAFRLDRDWGNPGQGPVQECVVFYHRGAGTIKINVTDGIIFHVDENRTGFNFNETLAQNRDTLERGGYGCTRANIKYVELKTYQ